MPGGPNCCQSSTPITTLANVLQQWTLTNCALSMDTEYVFLMFLVQVSRKSARIQGVRISELRYPSQVITCLGPRYSSSGGLDGTLSSGYTFKTFGTLGHIRHSAAMITMIRGWKIALSGLGFTVFRCLPKIDWLHSHRHRHTRVHMHLHKPCLGQEVVDDIDIVQFIRIWCVCSF